MSNKIQYCDIMKLGFKEQIESDSVYEEQHGFKYAIITKELTSKISLDWEKHSQLCTMIRIDNKRNGNIVARMPIRGLEHLKEIINFYTSDYSSLQEWKNSTILA